MSEVNKEDFLLAMEVYACCSSLLMDCVYIFNQGGGQQRDNLGTLTFCFFCNDFQGETLKSQPVHQDVLIHQVLELLIVKVIFRLYDEDGNAKVTKKEVRNIQCDFYSETLTQQVGRIHRLLAEPTVCERLGQCVEAVGKQVDTINLDR